MEDRFRAGIIIGCILILGGLYFDGAETFGIASAAIAFGGGILVTAFLGNHHYTQIKRKLSLTTDSEDSTPDHHSRPRSASDFDPDNTLFAKMRIPKKLTKRQQEEKEKAREKEAKKNKAQALADSKTLYNRILMMVALGSALTAGGWYSSEGLQVLNVATVSMFSGIVVILHAALLGYGYRKHLANVLPMNTEDSAVTSSDVSDDSPSHQQDLASTSAPEKAFSNAKPKTPISRSAGFKRKGNAAKRNTPAEQASRSLNPLRVLQRIAVWSIEKIRPAKPLDPVSTDKEESDEDISSTHHKQEEKKSERPSEKKQEKKLRAATHSQKDSSSSNAKSSRVHGTKTPHSAATTTKLLTMTSGIRKDESTPISTVVAATAITSTFSSSSDHATMTPSSFPTAIGIPEQSNSIGEKNVSSAGESSHHSLTPKSVIQSQSELLPHDHANSEISTPDSYPTEQSSSVEKKDASLAEKNSHNSSTPISSISSNGVENMSSCSLQNTPAATTTLDVLRSLDSTSSLLTPYSLSAALDQPSTPPTAAHEKPESKETSLSQEETQALQKENAELKREKSEYAGIIAQLTTLFSRANSGENKLCSASLNVAEIQRGLDGVSQIMEVAKQNQAPNPNDPYSRHPNAYTRKDFLIDLCKRLGTPESKNETNTPTPASSTTQLTPQHI